MKLRRKRDVFRDGWLVILRMEEYDLMKNRSGNQKEKKEKKETKYKEDDYVVGPA